MKNVSGVCGMAMLHGCNSSGCTSTTKALNSHSSLTPWSAIDKASAYTTHYCRTALSYKALPKSHWHVSLLYHFSSIEAGFSKACLGAFDTSTEQEGSALALQSVSVVACDKRFTAVSIRYQPPLHRSYTTPPAPPNNPSTTHSFP